MKREKEMEAKDYLEALIPYYKESFDLTLPYRLGGQEFFAYGYYFSTSEKYVLTRKANMWRANAYEHILFLNLDTLTMTDFENWKAFLEGEMEKELVRTNQKYPPEDHMVSELTFVFLCKKPVSKELQRKIRFYSFHKDYAFGMKGVCHGNLLCVSLEEKKIYASFGARRLRKLYESIFEKKEHLLPQIEQVI